MAEKNLDVRILSRIDTLANWESANPRIKLGEICIAVLDETDEVTNKTTRSFKMKIGDGAHDWEDLPFVYYTQPEVEAMLVSDGASAAKVMFSNDKFNSKNVAAALVELYGKIAGVETSIKELNDEAYEIKYSSTHSGLTDCTNVQQTLDYITDYLNAYSVDAKDVGYDNAVSNFTNPTTGANLTDVQAAMDAMYGIIPKNAAGLSYFNATSHLTGSTVQAAIDELDGRLDNSEKASGVSFDTTNTTGKLTKANVQEVLEEILGYVDDLEASDIAFTDTNAGGTQNTFVKGTEVQTALENIESALVTFYDYGVSKDLKSFNFDNTKTQIQADDSDSTIYSSLNAQQVMEYVINKFTLIKQNLAGAVSVTFDNTNTDIITGADVQVALEQLDTKVKSNLDRLDNFTASDSKYVNTTSSLTATNIQDAIDEIEGRVDTLESWEADDIKYTNTSSALTSINVQDAIDELDSRLDNSEKASGVSYSDTVSAMGTVSSPIDTVQKAIEKLDDRLDKSEKANGVSYDDTVYSIGKTNVQDAIDNTIGRVKDTEDLINDWDDATLSKFSTNSDGDLMFGTIKIGGTDDTFHKYASEISYDDTNAGMSDATTSVDTAQKALDKLDSRVDVIEGWKATNIPFDDTTTSMSTSSNTVDNVQKAIESIDSKLDTLELKAEKVTYTNTTSGMAATNVQDGIDEIDKRIDDLNASNVAYTEVGASSSTTVKSELDKILAWNANSIPYTDTTTTLGDSTNTVDTVQKAIEAIDKRLDTAEANKNTATDIGYDDTTSALGTGIDNVQKAIEAIDSKVDTLELKAEKITYDDTTSTMSLGANATVQKAIEKVDSRLDTIEGWKSEDINFTTTDTDVNKLTSTNVRDALDEVNNKLDTIAANKNTADDVTYDKTKTPKSVNATTVQGAIDVLASAISTTDGKISNEAKDMKYDNTTSAMTITPSNATLGVSVQDAIEKLDSRLDASEKADGVSYDNTTSKLTATTTQGALDEVVGKLGTIELKAEKVTFTPGTNAKDLKSTDVQKALEEVNGKLDTIADNKNTAGDIVFDNSTNGFTSSDAQSAIEEVNGNIITNADDLDYSPASGSTITDTNVGDVLDALVLRTDKIPTKIEELSYDNTKKNLLKATQGQAAIDELAKSIDNILDGTTSLPYDPTYATIVATNVQDAIDELDTKYQMYTGAKASYVEYDPTTSGRTLNKTVQGAIDKAFAEIDQIAAVVPFEILYFDVSGYTMDENRTIYVPSDTTINTLTLNWNTNKDCAAITLTGCSPLVTDKTATYSTPFNTDKNIDLTVKDNNGNIITETIKFKFVNKIYFGSAAEPATYDDTFVTGLSGYSIDENYKAVINVAASQYGYIALDTAVTDDEFYVNSMDVSLKNCGTVVIGTLVYNVYRTNQSGLGRIIIENMV